jgi:hypothetical protein
MAEDEDFERCPACGMGLEPRVVTHGSLETVEQSILESAAAESAALVCTNPDCPLNR